MAENKRYLSGTLLDDGSEYSMGELCRICDVNAEEIFEMVAEGILEPTGHDPAQWRFRGTSVVRIRIVLNLQQDLRVNLPGAALALELMDELEELRRLRRIFAE
jgi:chaperone modulatory protein CbpM